MPIDSPLFYYSAIDKAIAKARRKESYPLTVVYLRAMVLIYNISDCNRLPLTRNKLRLLIGEKPERFNFKIEKLTKHGFVKPVLDRQPVILTPLALSFIDSVLIEYRKVSARLLGEKKPLNKPKRKV